MRMVILFGLCVLFFAFVEPTMANESNGAGIVFFNTPQLEEIKDFYIDRIGCRLWIDQGTCAILKYGNLLIGFCSGEKRAPDGRSIEFQHFMHPIVWEFDKFK